MKKLYFAKRDGLFWMYDENGPIAGPYPNQKEAKIAYQKRLDWMISQSPSLQNQPLAQAPLAKAKLYQKLLRPFFKP